MHNTITLCKPSIAALTLKDNIYYNEKHMHTSTLTHPRIFYTTNTRIPHTPQRMPRWVPKEMQDIKTLGTTHYVIMGMISEHQRKQLHLQIFMEYIQKIRGHAPYVAPITTTYGNEYQAIMASHNDAMTLLTRLQYLWKALHLTIHHVICPIHLPSNIPIHSHDSWGLMGPGLAVARLYLHRHPNRMLQDLRTDTNMLKQYQHK